MANNEITRVEPPRPASDDDLVSYYRAPGASNGIWYGIVWSVPKTNEEAQKRYGCDLSALVYAGVRQFSTRLKVDSFFAKGVIKSDGHVEMQKAADAWQPGRTVTPSEKTAIKAKAAKLDALNEKARALGFASIDEMMASLG